MRLRRGTADDLDAMQAAYTRWAREHDGPLTRSGPQFPPDVTAFLQIGVVVVGYALGPAILAGFAIGIVGDAGVRGTAQQFAIRSW